MRRAQSDHRPRPLRHAVRMPCQVVRERDFRLIADQIENLSSRGMLVSPSDPVLTGEKLIVSFKAPLSRRWVDAECTVSRVVHGRRPGEFKRSLGLVFDHIDSFSRRLLEANLPWWPVSPPGCRPGRRDSADAIHRLARLSGGVAPSNRWVGSLQPLGALLS